MKLQLEVQLDGRDVIGQAERALVLAALEAAGGNISAAADLLGIHRQSLQRKIRRFQTQP